MKQKASLAWADKIYLDQEESFHCEYLDGVVSSSGIGFAPHMNSNGKLDRAYY